MSQSVGNCKQADKAGAWGVWEDTVLNFEFFLSVQGSHLGVGMSGGLAYQMY